MKAQLTEIILINLLQHKSPKFSSQKMASVLKRGQKNPFHYTNLCFLNYHLIFQLIRYQLIIVLTEGNSSLVPILKLFIQLQSNCLFLM